MFELLLFTLVAPCKSGAMRWYLLNYSPILASIIHIKIKCRRFGNGEVGFDKKEKVMERISLSCTVEQAVK
jgi:hypothetical protein